MGVFVSIPPGVCLLSTRAAKGDDVTENTPSTIASFAHTPEAKRKVVNRLRRAQGQLNAVITAVEGDAGCRDVVQQLAAVSKALDRAGFLVISTALKECLTDPDAEDRMDPEELERLFLSLA
ncbi:MAG: metal-sensitive transcriptional regulator [Actinobacteria bacterium]|nr:metal-sensitive transcriptional regulator [Actinomycetota bacterium]